MKISHSYLYQYYDILHEVGCDNVVWIENAWNQPHRFFHTMAHLKFILDKIEECWKEKLFNKSQYRYFILAAIFHDIVYEPRNNDNEQTSVDIFKTFCPKADNETVVVVSQIILETATHEGSTQLSRLFSSIDCMILAQPFEQLLEYERAIAKEYQFYSYDKYKEGRIKVLEDLLVYVNKTYEKNELSRLIEWLKIYRPKIGVYAGSFAPWHVGHLNILQKAEKLFDKVIILRAVNSDKNLTNIYNVNETHFHQIVKWNGMTTDYLQEVAKYADVTLIRGLRNSYDMPSETNMLRFMEDDYPEINVVYFVCDRQYEHISSSALRNISDVPMSHGMPVRYLPDEKSY